LSRAVGTGSEPKQTLAFRAPIELRNSPQCSTDRSAQINLESLPLNCPPSRPLYAIVNAANTRRRIPKIMRCSHFLPVLTPLLTASACASYTATIEKHYDIDAGPGAGSKTGSASGIGGSSSAAEQLRPLTQAQPRSTHGGLSSTNGGVNSPGEPRAANSKPKLSRRIETQLCVADGRQGDVLGHEHRG